MVFEMVALSVCNYILQREAIDIYIRYLLFGIKQSSGVIRIYSQIDIKYYIPFNERKTNSVRIHGN